ncbi:MAG: anhydro-N-acetylmuramic acid kinase [Burkholderiales bacterium]|nr:anhydro-N-acetylmuramic acid kinase [Burkholderiales bacterium]
MRRFIGLMSGTSIDAVDGALLEIGEPPGALRTTAFASRPIPEDLRRELETLQSPGADELARAALAANALAGVYADVVADLLAGAGCPAASVTAIGAHGQTVRHRPELGYTIQLLQPGRLAEACGIAVVCDLRAADVAAGGQGAPLAPAFHAEAFRDAIERRAVVNLGGIANISVLPAFGASEPVTGFDTGPANTLLDAWCRRHTGADFDRDGDWARGGKVDAALLANWLSEPYFALAPPKSTGRDLFDPRWLDRSLTAGAVAGPASGAPGTGRNPRDVQATLVELTAVTVGQACRESGAERVFVCGGGARNRFLMERLAVNAAPAPVTTTQALGVDPQAVEAAAFAWLAARRIDGMAGNLASVTGARGPRVLGLLADPRPRN